MLCQSSLTAWPDRQPGRRNDNNSPRQWEDPHSPYIENVIYSECPLAAKWDISPKFLNLNARALAADYSDSPIIKWSVKPGKFVQSTIDLRPHYWGLYIAASTTQQTEMIHSVLVDAEMHTLFFGLFMLTWKCTLCTFYWAPFRSSCNIFESSSMPNDILNLPLLCYYETLSKSQVFWTC
jgi:hypothetical protein